MLSPLPSPPQVARALADVLGEHLALGRAVDVPGLGRFARRHEPGRLLTHPDGAVMQPPADVVAFTPLPSPLR